MFLINPEKKSILDLTLTSSTAAPQPPLTTATTLNSASRLSRQDQSKFKTNIIPSPKGGEGGAGRELVTSFSETSYPTRSIPLQYLIRSSAVLVKIFIDYFQPLKQWLALSIRSLFTLLSALFLPTPSSGLTSTGSNPNHPLSWLKTKFHNHRRRLTNFHTLLNETHLKYNNSLNSERQHQASLWINRTCTAILSLSHSRHIKSIGSPQRPLQYPVLDSCCKDITKYLNMDLYSRRNSTESAASKSRPSTMSACNWPESSQKPMGENQLSFKQSPPPLLMLSSNGTSSLSLASHRHLSQSQQQHQHEQQQQTWMPAQAHSNHHLSTYGVLQIETNSDAGELNTEPPTLIQLPNQNQYNHHPQYINRNNYEPGFQELFGSHKQQQFPTNHKAAPASNLRRRNSLLSSTLLSSDEHSNFTSDMMQSYNTSLERSSQHLAESADRNRHRASMSISSSNSNSMSPLVLVSKDTLSDLTNKMKDLEEQVKAIPELQRRLEHVIIDSNDSSAQEFHHKANISTGGFNMNRNSSASQRLLLSHGTLDEKMIRKPGTNDSEAHPRGSSPLLQRQYTWIKSSSVSTNNSNSNHNKRDDNRSTMTNGSVSLQTTPVKHQTTPLDCGCQSFKEHLRYNSISRENRLNYIKYQSIRCTRNNNNISPQPQPSIVTKVDASTNTDLLMQDVVSRDELNRLLNIERKTYQANLSSYNHISRYSCTKSSSIDSEQGTSGSLSEQKSSSPQESQTDSCGDEEQPFINQKPLESFSRALLDDIASLHVNDHTNGQLDCKNQKLDEMNGNDFNRDEEDDDEDEDSRDSRTPSSNGQEPCSLGSSYQDPSDFEEYKAYGESLDRRTKDFISVSTKLPNDLKFALIRLNDLIKKKRSLNQVESTSSCLDIIRKAWFEVSTKKDSQSSKMKLYVDYIESMTKQLLNLVVNLIDSAGNTAMHYAASDCKLDIIKILLDTKVCDINCRNKAGYTPIMLLALAELDEQQEQDIARQLFSLGDVNIMAQSSGQTALMLAASHGRVATCKLLLECGANPSLQDYDGSTALMCGSEIGNEEVVRCLLAHKLTDLTATDNDGLDALTIAMNNGHKKIGLMLYAAKNVPRMTRSSFTRSGNTSGSYLGASLRRTRGKTSNIVRRADSLLNRSRLSGYS